MELILLEKVHNLGDLGDTVIVKPGYGRNFLLPRGKAVPATRENKKKFEAERDELQRQAGEKLASAEARREAIDELEAVVFHVNVSPEGRLYGSISAREIADKLEKKGVRLALGATVYDPTDPMGKMFFNILATFAEFEADLIRMRTREGMAIARARGKLRGKQPKLSDKQQKELLRMHDTGEYSISDLAELFSVSRPTVYRTLTRQASA